MGKLITQLDPAQTFAPATDYFVVRQTTATGNKTRRITGEEILEDVNASIVTVTAAVQTAQDTADAAIPLTQKGAANGVATLDGSGKVPASQLTIVAAAFQGNWDATNNSPALIDGTGTGGDWYFVQTVSGNDFSRDLGSGAVDWTPGALIIYNGTIWVENEAVNQVLAVNGLTGNVSLTTSEIPEATDLNYVTDDQSDSFPAGATAIDQLVKQSTLDAAIAGISGPSIVVIGDILTPQTFSDGITDCDNGENTLLSSKGYTNGDAEAQWPLAAEAWGSIDASVTSFADVQWQSVLWSLKSGINYTVQSLPNKAYAFNRCGILIPSGKDSPNINTDSQHYEVNFSNCLYYNRSGAPKTIFLKQPEDQTEADIVIDNQWTFKNGKFRGPGGVGDIGMKIGATRGCRFQFLEFQNFQYGLQGGFLLNSRFEEVNSISCSSAGVFIDKGWWSGAGYSNAGAQPKFYNCRFRMTSATQRGLWVIGPDGAAVYDSTVEGTDAAYGIFIDTNTSTVSKNARVVNLHAEIGSGNQFTNAVVGFSGRDFYTFIVDAIYNQSQAPDTTLVECTATQGTTTMKVLNCKGNTGSGRFKFRNINSGGAGAWVYEDTQIQGDPDTVDDIRNDGLCYTADSDIPPAARIRYTKPLA